MREIRKERVYACRLETLWAAIATREGLSGWLMPCDFVPVIGSKFTFRTKPAPGFDGVVHGEVLALEELRLVRFRWRSGRMSTVVSLTIESVDPRNTKLCVRHSGFSGLSSVIARIALGLGWRKLLRRELPAWLSRTEREARQAPVEAGS